MKQMTKKEIRSIQTKAIIKAVNENFDVIQDFEDTEGHGFFSFTLEVKGQTMCFDMSRNGFDFVSYAIKGDNNHELGKELESELESLRDITLDLLEQETGFPAS